MYMLFVGVAELCHVPAAALVVILGIVVSRRDQTRNAHYNRVGDCSEGVGLVKPAEAFTCHPAQDREADSSDGCCASSSGPTVGLQRSSHAGS